MVLKNVQVCFISSMLMMQQHAVLLETSDTVFMDSIDDAECGMESEDGASEDISADLL